MNNKIITVGNVRGYVDANNSAWLNAEDVARGWGFTQTQNKGGKTYTSVRWERVNAYLKEFGFPPLVGENDFIPENMVYRLGFKASNEKAQAFQKELADNVIPSIRKHGAYMTPETLEKMLLNPDAMIKTLMSLKEEQEKRKAAERQIEIDRPKVVFADAVSVSSTCILIGDLAKLIKQNGVNIGQKRLFAWLRDNGYLIKRKGSDYNMPTQRSMEMKLFEVKETTITHSDGHNTISKTTKVTGKGQQYFINKFLSENGETRKAN